MSLRNQALIKTINRCRILDAVRRRKAASRSEVAAEIGLDKKSLTNFVGELSREGLLREVGKKEQKLGRPSTLLEFAGKTVGGIAISPDRVMGALMDFYGRVVFSYSVALPAFPERDAVLDAVRAVYGKLSRREIYRGVGVCMPGILDMEAGVVRGSINIPSLNGLNFREVFPVIIRDRLLYFEEESRANALAEKWFGEGREHDDFAVVDIRQGTGAGLIANRRLFKGAGQYAGELGHMVVLDDGPLCRCGNRGCFEALVSEKILLEKAAAIYGRAFVSIERLPETPCPEFAAELATAGRLIGRVLAALINILNPPLIALSGPLITRYERVTLPAVLAETRARCLKICADDTRIVVSRLTDGPVLGAATLPLSDIFEVPDYFYV